MAQDSKARSNGILMLVMCAVLFWGAWQALFVPAGEFPPAGVVWLDLVLDAGVTVALAALVLMQAAGTAGPLRAVLAVLAPLAVIAGLVQIGVRFTSDHAWWTGHYLPPVL
jgi:hypothetical protein